MAKKSSDYMDDGTLSPYIQRSRVWQVCAALDLLVQLDDDKAWEMVRQQLDERQLTARVQAKLFP